MDKDDTFDRLKKAAASGRRSTLYRWMMSNYDRFARTLIEAGRPNWDELAQTFTELGLKSRDEARPLTGDGVRLTWRKVRVARAKTPITQAAASPAAPILPEFDPARDVAFPIEALRPDDDDPEFYDVTGRPF